MRKIVLLLILLFIVSCTPTETTSKNDGMNKITGQHVTELQKTACSSADKAGTCDTKLPRLGFITKEECCAQFEKCC